MKNLYLYKSLQSIIKYKKIIEMKVLGDSMFPTLCDGEIITVHSIDIDKIEVGDIIVHFYWKKSLTIHRVIEIKIEGTKSLFITKGDNNDYVDDYFVDEECVIGII